MTYTDSYSRLTRRIAETLAVVLFASVLVVQALNIFFRYSQITAPWEWVEEFSKFALIWMFFLLWHLSDREGRHFVVDFLSSKMSPGLRRCFDGLGHLIAVVFTAIVVVSSYKFVYDNWGIKTQSIDWLPNGAVYLIIPIGLSFVFVERLRMLVRVFYRR